VDRRDRRNHDNPGAAGGLGGLASGGRHGGGAAASHDRAAWCGSNRGPARRRWSPPCPSPRRATWSRVFRWRRTTPRPSSSTPTPSGAW
jgi:hypothetical protein